MENYLYYSDPFFAYNNALYIERTINGKPVNIKLSNFLARITEDITCTNGAENERFLSIVGTDDKGNDLRKITVPLKNFAQLDWAQEHWVSTALLNQATATVIIFVRLFSQQQNMQRQKLFTVQQAGGKLQRVGSSVCPVTATQRLS